MNDDVGIKLDAMLILHPELASQFLIAMQGVLAKQMITQFCFFPQ